MQLDDWTRRLRAETGLQVDGAAELAAAQADQQRDGAFVFYTADAAEANQLAGALRQRRTITVGVALAVGNRSRRGAAGVTELERHRAAVFAALLGWAPPHAVAPVTYRAGRMLSFSKSTLWWLDEFQVSEFLSAA